MHRSEIYAAALLAAALAGCAGRAPPAGDAVDAIGAIDATDAVALAPSADSAAAWYRQAALKGERVLAVDSGRSLIAVTVRRGGTLARLGHDHVVASRAVTGFVAPEAGRADFRFRLDAMTVDDPGLRLLARLDTQPSGAAIAGTRANMLGRVLEAQRFPLVLLRAERVAGRGETLRLSITLHGVTRTAWVPTRIETLATGIVASGNLLLRQSEFGITPLSVMGGAIAVQDTMELRFRIEARPAPATTM